MHRDGIRMVLAHRLAESSLPGTEGSRCGLLFHLLLASPRPLETEATLLIEVGAALVRSVCAESQGAASVCGKNRKQEGSCHQPWAVGSSTSPQCFCLSEAKDEQSSIYLNSSQLGPEKWPVGGKADFKCLG